ncbi:MAG: outer membrane protein OmpA-like peptidoglycan-associated protein [Candidatus Krumholzibacteriia bacterium]|jgi:outer membrane protein OmpA-like peptidoglycan-associated protein
MKSHFSLCSTILALCVLLPSLSTAQEQTTAPSGRDHSGLWGIGLEFGAMKLTEGAWDYSTVNEFGGLQIMRGLNPNWNLALSFRSGHVRPGAEVQGQEVGWSGTSSAPLYTTIFQPALKIQHRFRPDSKFTPTAGFGVGLTSWKVVDLTGEDVGWFPSGDAIFGFDTDGNVTALEGSDFTMLFEVGLSYALSKTIDLNLGGRYDILTGNSNDNIGLSSYWGPEHVDANTALVSYQIGVTWWFGSGDRDRDGIPDDKDMCPDQPEDMDGYNDLDGCPDPDNDGDGILDADDACPTRAEDLDGFQDEDGCPDPDNDGDGIYDGRDSCPNEAEDIDGWQDQDGCPDPDNDQDGVLDINDRCPRTPVDSQVDEHGCAVTAPTIEAAAVFIPAIKPVNVIEGVNFVSGSAELTPSSITILISLAQSLNEDKSLRYEIQGHTDSTGDAEINRSLSQQRAESVRASLIQMGVASDRLAAVGYGEDVPIADNATAGGRAANRRVELHAK